MTKQGIANYKVITTLTRSPAVARIADCTGCQ